MVMLLQNRTDQNAKSSSTEAALRRKAEDAFNKMSALEHLTAAEDMFGPDTSHDALISIQKHLAAIDSQGPEAKRASALKKRADARLKQLEKQEQQQAAKRPAAQASQDSVSRSLLDYLNTGFGHPGAETSWFNHIKGVYVDGETARVTTDLASRGDSASGICRAVSGFIYASDNARLGLQHVEIVGVKDRTLIFRFGISGKCE